MRNFLILLAFFASFSCKNQMETHNRDLPFNEDWKFVKGEIAEGANVDFDDTDWRDVDLPHDISVEDLDVQDSIHIGSHSKEVEMGVDVGFLVGGTAWYRKHFNIDSKDQGKQFILHFDGIQCESEVFVNGKKAHENVYGYTAFNVNITDFLNEAGQENVIAVKAHNPEVNSRWFAGFGINRAVHLSIVDPVHIADWGVFITSPEVSADKALINFQLELNNTLSSDVDIDVEVVVLDPANKIVGQTEQVVTISRQSVSKSTVDMQLLQPLFWDLESPNLYTAEVALIRDGKQVDVYQQKFGIRSIEFTVEEGFKLNGKKVLLKGACMHHDNGLLGAAAFKDAEYRRVRIMKENGFSAIRTSHNPPSGYFLDACDDLGMLVIDEAFDMWELPKRKNDYHVHFNENWEKDLEAMLLRDRNHPSIILWSYGNEIKERARPRGIEIAEMLVDKIKTLDSSRPTTQAICHFWDNPDQNWEEHTPAAFAVMDVAGYNYRWANYESDHELYPERIMYGSESFAKEAFENWQQVERHSYVIGDFVWTGMDYIGESGIGHSVYKDTDEEEWIGLPGWPWYVAFCGDIDLVGKKKPQSRYRDVVWGESELEVLVHEPVPDDKYEHLTAWGWPKEFCHWNWGKGDELSVNVYSSHPKVRLELNGEVVGEQELDLEKGITANFKVPYKAGHLKAVAIGKDGVEIAKVLQTFGVATQLNLTPEQQTIEADRSSLMFIEVNAQDKDGNLVSTSAEETSIELEGEGELLAAGSANPLISGSLQDDRFNLFMGRGLIIVRSTGQQGKIVVRASANGMLSTEIKIEAK